MPTWENISAAQRTAQAQAKAAQPPATDQPVEQRGPTGSGLPEPSQVLSPWRAHNPKPAGTQEESDESTLLTIPTPPPALSRPGDDPFEGLAAGVSTRSIVNNGSILRPASEVVPPTRANPQPLSTRAPTINAPATSNPFAGIAVGHASSQGKATRGAKGGKGK